MLDPRNPEDTIDSLEYRAGVAKSLHADHNYIMGKLLGNVIESFTMGGTHRVLLVDEDCSTSLKYGEKVEVRFASGNITKVVVFDGFLESGEKYGATAEKISSLRTENIGFPEYKDIIGSQIFLAD